jgi:gamma-glutamyltranspeptidase
MFQHAQGAVVTPHHLATQEGNRILKEGGTAVDAMIAASAVLCVVYPHMVSLAGDSWTLLGEGGRVRAVDGTGRAPRLLDADVLRAQGETSMPERGPHTVTVPGAVSAWGLMHAEGGRLDFGELLATAIDLAERGVPVSASLARDIVDYRALLEPDPGCRNLFFSEDGRAKTVDDRIVQPQLASTLRSLATHGPGAFYEGPVAEAFVAGMAERGSQLTLEDLKGHRSTFVEPLVRRYGDAEVFTAPPCSQGFVFLQVLGAMDLRGTRGWTRGNELEWLPRAAEAFGVMRDALLGDPGRMSVTGEELVSDQTILEVLERSSLPRDPDYIQPSLSGDTIALMASDAEGRVISHIQSVSGAFGSGILEQGTGVIAHNRGSAFTLHPGAPSELTGSTKPPHTLMPALARRQGRIVAAAGTMGGKNQPMIVAQVMSRLLEGASPQEAVDAPRWVVPAVEGSEESVILVEKAMDAAARAYLDAAGIPVEQIDVVDNRLGHAQALLIGEDFFQAGSDSRADGRV